MHADRFDAIEFLDYLRARSVLIAAFCGMAVLMAFVISMLLPKRYTASATVLIEAPAGNDPRASTAVSQVYLDSLKTYESFAASDTLFLQAADRLHLAAANRGVLKVSKLPNTSILQISATWRDPRQAQALAQYIAEQTVARGNSIEARSSNELLKGIREELSAARRAWTNARQRRDAFVASNPVESLEDEIAGLSRFASNLDRDVELATADLAELSAEQPASAQTSGIRARVAALEEQRRQLTERRQKLSGQLEARKVRRAVLDDDEDAAHTSYNELQARLDDNLSSPSLGGSHLEIIDPGIVPRQPSYPNTTLNIVAAFLAAIVASFAFLVFRFSYAQLIRASAERAYSLR